MSKKEIFIEEITQYINEGTIILSDEAKAYFDSLISKKSESNELSEKATIILDKVESGEKLTAAEIGERTDMAARSVSGAMRKLVENGYFEKIDTKPVTYVRN